MGYAASDITCFGVDPKENERDEMRIDFIIVVIVLYLHCYMYMGKMYTTSVHHKTIIFGAAAVRVSLSERG